MNIQLRDPKCVMKLSKLGSFHQSKLSFLRSFLREFKDWKYQNDLFNLDEDGFGTAVYSLSKNNRTYSLVCFANKINDEERSDRVIAKKWDATFTLTTKKPDEEKLQYLKENIPLQEAGRCTSDEIILSRANKSVRLFNYVAEKLAFGQQPNKAKLIEVGYLMRTTAVYGNGKFGLADFEYMRGHGLFTLPFQAEMLCVYLARNFSFDWVEHIASKIKPKLWCHLDENLKRGLGVGNATGLGMAPFLVNHPKLISSWISTREQALQRVKQIEDISNEKRAQFTDILAKAKMHVEEWFTTDQQQAESLSLLKKEIENPTPMYNFLMVKYGWRHLSEWSTKHLNIATQELVNSALIEMYPEFVDQLEAETGADENVTVIPGMTLDELDKNIETNYGWALAVNSKDKKNNARFWYASENKEEPRFGWRYLEPGTEKEMRIGIAQEVQRLKTALAEREPITSKLNVAEFLILRPEFREIIQRIQSLQNYPYAEIRDNLLADICRPINLLRCKLAIFGATKFDPKSDLWIRVTLFQGAPLNGELKDTGFDNWLFPSIKTSS